MYDVILSRFLALDFPQNTWFYVILHALSILDTPTQTVGQTFIFNATAQQITRLPITKNALRFHPHEDQIS